jgi:hypothetical protein
MKWYYQWKLRKIQNEISSLQDSSSSPLIENYTGHARLRSLTRVAEHLQQRLERTDNPAAQS